MIQILLMLATGGLACDQCDDNIFAKTHQSEVRFIDDDLPTILPITSSVATSTIGVKAVDLTETRQKVEELAVIAVGLAEKLARAERRLAGEESASVVWTIVAGAVGGATGALGGSQLPGELHGIPGASLGGGVGALTGGVIGALFGDDATWLLGAIADTVLAE